MGKGATSGAALERLRWPWWSGAVLAAVGYALLRWLVPALAGSSAVLRPMTAAAQSAAMPVALSFLVFSGVSLYLTHRRRRAFDLALSLAALRALPLERFERFVVEALTKERYVIVSSPRDGVVDFEAMHAGERHFVQCRRWRCETIDIDALSELYARAQAQGAAGCIMVTTGGYSAATRRFASGKPVQLIAGQQLAGMLSRVGPAADTPVRAS